MSVTKLLTSLFSFNQYGFYAQPSLTGHGISPQPPIKKPAWLLGLVVAAGAMLLAAFGAENMQTHPAQEIAWLRHLAEDGDAGAQLQLGLAYRNGRYGLTPDPETGLYWLTQAASNGQSYAADLVGTAYAEGQGTARDQANAQRWWTLAASAGNTDAAKRLGEQLAANDPRQAEHWLKRAAARGDAQAAHDLHALYAQQAAPGSDLQLGKHGLDVIAAQTGSPTLKTLAGAWNLLRQSAAATQDTGTLLRNAQAGDPTAEFQLGLRYRDGAWSVPRDPAQARYWLQRAAADGNRLAAQALNERDHG